MNSPQQYYCLRITPTAEAGVRVVLRREGQEAELAADTVATFDTNRLESLYLKPLRAFIAEPVAPELLKEMGRELADLLLPAGVRPKLQAELLQSVTAAGILRLSLEVADPRLAGLPWEYAYLDEETLPAGLQGFLGLHPRLCLVRRPAVTKAIEPVEAAPLRVLIVWADPRSASYPALPHLQAEVKSILSELRASRLQDRIEVYERPSATPGSLQRILEERPPHVLHFIGHGDARPSGGFLALEGDRPGREKPVYADELARWLSGTPARLAVLSACQTGASIHGIAQTLAEAGIGAVVAMQMPLRDAAARPFARSFYGTLLETGAVEEAMQEGRQAIQGFGPDWGVPVLTLAGANGTLFRLPAPATLSSLPDGVVTFLFTDIEGSTERWQKYPKTMPGALKAHNDLIQEAVEQHHGQVFKTMGDAFCAAFIDPVEALNAALEAQKTLCAQDWSRVGDLRVRIVLHTGTAERVGDDYFGLTLSRVARLLKVCQGGQVLLSQATYELIREALPDKASLKDHGSHRLPDLREPEHIFQMLHPALPADRLTLRSLDALPNNLPQQLSSFIGREREVQEVTQSLTKTRLLTLTGAGGCGKTRLALQVAADVLNDYEDGVWLVELAPLSDAALVPQAVASALGVLEAPGQSLTETLAVALKAKTLLLLLDNCEHLLKACGDLTHTLLRACPRLRILATSRKGMDMEGEMLYPVSPLSLPDPKTLPPLEMLSQSEAVRLFCERAAFKLPDFALTEQNAAAVTRICRRVDGIPLAIELAAARLSALSVEQIAQFDDYFRLLTDRRRTKLPHQQALRATLEWSYDLLTPQEQALLCRLSVFAGGWTLEAAEQVCSGDGLEAWEILDLMAALVEASHVIAEDREGARRYRMLETIRQYAADKLAETGRQSMLCDCHLNYFLALAEEAETMLVGPEQGVWLNRIELEHENVRTALSRTQNVEQRLRLAGAMWRFWYIRGYWSEGRIWLESVHNRDEIRSSVRAKALNGAGVLAWSQADYKSAQTLLKESLGIRRSISDERGVAETLNLTGNVMRSIGDMNTALACYQESLIIWRRLDNQGSVAKLLGNLGMIARDEANYELARTYFEESLKICHVLGDLEAESAALMNLGVVYYELGEFDSSTKYYEGALSIHRAANNRSGIALALSNIAKVLCRQGNYMEARQLLEESLRLRVDLGDKSGIAFVLGYLGVAAKNPTDPYRAVLLLSAGQAIHEQIGELLPLPLRREHEKNIADLRIQLGEPAFQATWEKGRRMTLQEAITYALQQDS